MRRIVAKKRVKRPFNPCKKEFYIQKSFFEWLSRYPSIRGVSFSVPNDGATRAPKETFFLKMTGLTPGAPDVLIMCPHGQYHGLVIEFKSALGTLSVVQKQMLERLAERGYLVCVCRSLEAAVNVVQDYFGSYLIDTEVE